MAGMDELPKGALPFHQLPISKSQKLQFFITMSVIISLALVSTLLFIMFDLPLWGLIVIFAFVALYKRGLIYRGNRMVNWCPATQTAISDEEVIMKPQKGFLYKI